MNEQIQINSEQSLINLLFDEGLQSALPRIAEILMNTAMLIERERHIGVAPHQRSTERNGSANGFKPRSYQAGIGSPELSVPQVRESSDPFRTSLLEKGSRSDCALKASFNAPPWQRCQFDLQHNAQDYVTKQHLKSKVASDIKTIFNADDQAHAEERLKDFVKTNQETQPKLATWAEQNLPEGFSVIALPESHRKRSRTSNACENVNGQIKRRTRVVGLFPSEESLLRLVTGVLIEISETWETTKAYLKFN